jgi:hypothetical protein
MDAGSDPKNMKRVTDPTDPIYAIILRVLAGTLGAVQADDMLITLLLKLGFARMMQIHCSQLGFDPSNRKCTGGNGQEVPLLLEDILLMGWSLKQVAHALCVEIIPGDLTVEEFNRKWINNQTYKLAPVESNFIHFGTLACSDWAWWVIWPVGQG